MIPEPVKTLPSFHHQPWFPDLVTQSATPTPQPVDFIGWNLDWVSNFPCWPWSWVSVPWIHLPCHL